jgi:hypothetical protein
MAWQLLLKASLIQVGDYRFLGTSKHDRKNQKFPGTCNRPPGSKKLSIITARPS